MAGSLARPIVWDIYEEHLDEAAWLWNLWEGALDSPLYALRDVEIGPEERLRAHLDGLVLGGRRVAEKLLLPAIVEEDPCRVAAAAWALVQAEDADHQDVVFGALGAAAPPARAAIARALALSPRADLSRLVPFWHTGAPPLQAIVMEVFGLREPDWLRERIDPALRSGEPSMIVAGLKALRVFPGQAFLDHIKDALQTPDSSVRQQAVLAGIGLGSKTAWTVCRQLATAPGDDCRLPLGLLAISADPNDRALVRKRLADPEARRHALWALGFAGDIESVESLLAATADEETAPLAGEALWAITGLAVAGPLAKAGETKGPTVEEVADDDPPPVVRPEDSLPVPLPGRIKGWWDEARARFRPDTRYLFGRPRGAEVLRAALTGAMTWRREVLWIELGATVRNLAPLDLKAWARDQRQQLAGEAPPPRVGPR